MRACPPAGKSTLINAMVGQKLSIVTHKPQTTRHRVVAIESGPNHQMILFDTPGETPPPHTHTHPPYMRVLNDSPTSVHCLCPLAAVQLCTKPCSMPAGSQRRVEAHA
jgi:GTP-binding protein Era